MVTRAILRNWLLLGIGLGVLGAVQVYIATERSIPALVMVGFGVLIGMIGGLGRLFIEWRRGGLGGEPERWTSIPLSRRLEALVVASLAIGAGFARAAGAPVAVYVAILAIAVVISLLSFVVRRRA
ncbi:MAG TPA: hypothetical protein VGV93_00215 [Acidimicrobiales bacterium]|nr:hypothetical protein [Acidimicrobiales bacterium]